MMLILSKPAPQFCSGHCHWDYRDAQVLPIFRGNEMWTGALKLAVTLHVRQVYQCVAQIRCFEVLKPRR